MQIREAEIGASAFRAWRPRPELRPKVDHISLKTKTASFNHIFEYAIHEKRLWVKPIGSSAEDWTELPFDRDSNEEVPMELSVDGANLVVLDSRGLVHYKKVISEKWQPDKKGDIDHGTYAFRPKNKRFNWKDRWFSLPFLHHLVTPFIGKRLSLPYGTRDWAISHRGQFNHYIEDSLNHKHPVDQGVTTLYALDATGKDIYMYDPWKPKNVRVKVNVPETAKSTFEAYSLSASASTIMIFGDEFTKQDEEWGGRPCIYEAEWDIDSLGWNPGLKYSYDPKESDPHKRYLPGPGWRRHELPVLHGDAEVSKQISILQTGEGNDAREMRIVGRNE